MILDDLLVVIHLQNHILMHQIKLHLITLSISWYINMGVLLIASFIILDSVSSTEFHCQGCFFSVIFLTFTYPLNHKRH